MTKIAIIYFSFSKDAKLLSYSLTAIERLRKNYPDVQIDAFVYDDANSPLPSVPDNVTYEQTTFERKNNLNDYKCIAGMLEKYKKAADDGYNWIIKCDCDTYINNLDWVLSLEPESVSQVGQWIGSHFQGPCYAISAKAAKELSEQITVRKIKIYVQLCYLEDKTFTKLTEKYATGEQVKNQALGYCFDDFSNIRHFYSKFAVDFKRCLWLTKADTWQTNREDAEKRMEKYISMIQ